MRARVILVEFALIAAIVLIAGSPHILTLNEGTDGSIANNPVDIINIKMGEDVHERLQYYFELNYPLEYGVCIYGKANTTEVKILYEDASIIEQTETSVRLLCPKWNKGLRYLGTIHSHPSANSNWCVLSKVDIDQDELVSGVHCRDDHIVIYYRGDNYSRGYFAEIV